MAMTRACTTFEGSPAPTGSTPCSRLSLERGGIRTVIAPTCDALDEFSPGFLVPAHCTGRRATHPLAARFPAAFIPNGVGPRFEFAATDA